MNDRGDDGVTVRSGATGGIGWLEHRIVVPAGPEAVWKAYTTSEGLEGWAAPFVAADFRLDGPMEAGYRADARPGDPDNILDRFIAFVPGRMLAFSAERMPSSAPMDGALWKTMHQVVELARVAGGTEVRQTIVGFGEGPGYERIRTFMTAGNRWALTMLRQFCERGPVGWPAALKAMNMTANKGEGVA